MMKREESDQVSAAKIGTCGVIAAALISALAAIIITIINTPHDQKQNESNANIATVINENKNNANAPGVNRNIQIQTGNNNQNSSPPPSPSLVPPSYKVDWGAFKNFFTVSDIRIEAGPNVAETLNFVIQAKTSYSTFNQAPIFKAEFLDGEGILIGPVGSTIVDYNPHPINWDTQTRSRVSISLPTGDNRFKLRLIRFSRIA